MAASPPAQLRRTLCRNWKGERNGRTGTGQQGQRRRWTARTHACGGLAVPVDEDLGDGEGRLEAEGGEAKEGDVGVEVVKEEVAEADEAGVQA